MSDSSYRWPRYYAEDVANELKGLLEPACDRIEIAGSLRRGLPAVGDIELLCIPKASDSVFAADQLDAILQGLLGASRLGYRLSKDNKRTYGPQNKLLVDHWHRDLPVDVFTATEENWGMYSVVRTGPKDFNIRFMQRLIDLHMKGHAYPKPGQGAITSSTGADIFCPTEEKVFECLGWDYQAPEERK